MGYKIEGYLILVFVYTLFIGDNIRIIIIYKLDL